MSTFSGHILTREQWMAAIEEAELSAGQLDRANDNDGARTTQEWRELFGWTFPRVMAHLRQGVREGWLEVTWVRRTNITGISQRRPAYRVKPKVKAKEAPAKAKRKTK